MIIAASGGCGRLGVVREYQALVLCALQLGGLRRVADPGSAVCRGSRLPPAADLPGPSKAELAPGCNHLDFHQKLGAHELWYDEQHRCRPSLADDGGLEAITRSSQPLSAGASGPAQIGFDRLCTINSHFPFAPEVPSVRPCVLTEITAI